MDKEEFNNLKVSLVIDGRGASTPGPLLAARRSMAKVHKGEVLEIISSDKESDRNIEIWAHKAGHEYLGTIEYPGYSGIFVRSGN
jgi:tRNA 2-thiouridine synthesizing protein A